MPHIFCIAFWFRLFPLWLPSNSIVHCCITKLSWSLGQHFYNCLNRLKSLVHKSEEVQTISTQGVYCFYIFNQKVFTIKVPMQRFFCPRFGSSFLICFMEVFVIIHLEVLRKSKHIFGTGLQARLLHYTRPKFVKCANDVNKTRFKFD